MLKLIYNNVKKVANMPKKEVVYRKEYKIRAVGDGGVEMTVPKIVIERAAEKEHQTLQEFLATHKVVHLFNNFTDFDAAYRFIRIEEPTEEIRIPSIK